MPEPVGMSASPASMMATPATGRPWLPFVVLGLGLLVISFGAVLARLAQAESVPSLVVATWRLGLAAIVVTPLALIHGRRELLALTRQQLLMALLAGLFLALHFATWISSLEYTSVASSTALVTTNPLWIGLAGFLFFGERPNRLMVGGIALSLAGSLFIFWSDSQNAAAGSQPLWGNFLALVGSWCFSAYLLTGRRLRAGLGLSAYVWLAYGTAAVLLVLASGASGAPLLAHSAGAWLALAGMAFGPQLLGHTAYNWSLRHVSATFVAVVTLGEPVGSAIMAWIIFDEGFVPLQFVGFSLLLAGIYLAARGESRQQD